MRTSLVLLFVFALAACDSTTTGPATSPFVGFWQINDEISLPTASGDMQAVGNLLVSEVVGDRVSGYANTSIRVCDGNGACPSACQVSGPFEGEIQNGRFAVRLTQKDQELPAGSEVTSELAVLGFGDRGLEYRVKVQASGVCRFDEVVGLAQIVAN